MIQFNVIIPCFNVQSFIEDCLDSILIQDKNDIDVICIDDNSTDDTLKILKQYQSKYHNIKILQSKKQGPGHCRNLGLEFSNAPYLVFVDSDDFLSPGLFRDLRENIKNHKDIDIFTYGYRLFDDSTLQSKSECLKDDLDTSNMLIGNSSLAVWNKCYKTLFLKENKSEFREMVKVEDIDFMIKIASNKPKVLHLNSIYYNWRSRKNTESRNISDQYIQDYFKSMEKSKAIIEKTYSTNKIRRLFLFFYLSNYQNLLNKINNLSGTEKTSAYLSLNENFQKNSLSKVSWIKLVKLFPKKTLMIFIDPHSTLFFTDSNQNTLKFLKVVTRKFYFLLIRFRIFKFIKFTKNIFKNYFTKLKKIIRQRIHNYFIFNFMKSKFIKLELVLKDGQLSQEEFENFLLRSAWYFAPFINSIRSIHVFNQNLKIPKTLTAPSIITPEVNQHISLLLKKLTNEKDDRGGGIINKKYMISIRETSKPLNNSSINLNPRLKGADSRYLSLYSTIFGAKIGSVNKGRKRLLKLKAQINKKKVYLLGTGPSFSSVENNDFSDGELIICNSIVSNKNFLEKWRPKLAVCADPIFHAGYSVYAKAFRDDLKDMVVKYGTYVIVPERDIHIYEHFLPEISSNLIAIPFARNYESINTELQKEFKVSVTSNILTLYMLPIAGYIFETICIAGCDGRSLKDDQYFWSHDKKVQYNDKMKDIQIAHPGFFKLDYNEYYLQHCSTLEKWIKSLENNGKKIINLTSSYIPILNARNASNVQSYEESYYAEINNAIKSY